MFFDWVIGSTSLPTFVHKQAMSCLSSHEKDGEGNDQSTAPPKIDRKGCAIDRQHAISVSHRRNTNELCYVEKGIWIWIVWLFSYISGLTGEWDWSIGQRSGGRILAWSCSIVTSAADGQSLHRTCALYEFETPNFLVWPFFKAYRFICQDSCD